MVCVTWPLLMINNIDDNNEFSNYEIKILQV